MTKQRRGLLWLALALAGCEFGAADAELETSPCEGHTCAPTEAQDTEEAPPGSEVTPAPSTAVDILVVLDNSGWMAEEQALVGDQLGSLLDALSDGGYDARLASTTTDAGNYWCRSASFTEPAFGRFESSTCLARLEDFHFGGDDSNAESVCTDHCSLASVETSPQVPWIESSATQTNLRGATDVSEAAACLALPGINGCGYESPLEAISLALQHTQSPDHDEFGFLREDAHLLVVIISDEADCSTNPQTEEAVFGEGGIGNQVFWPTPEDGKPPNSAICWNAGVRCEDGDCWPEDYDVDGSPTDDPEQAALVPVSTYLSELSALREAKNQMGAEVFVFGILGVPEHYPETRTLTYAQGPGAEDPESFQAGFGTAPGCSSAIGEAVPPVRLRAVIESDQMSAANNIYSICSTDYTPAFEGMAEAVISYAP